MLVLFEAAAGYSLFKVLDEGKLEKVDSIFKEFNSAEKAAQMCVIGCGARNVGCWPPFGLRLHRYGRELVVVFNRHCAVHLQPVVAALQCPVEPIACVYLYASVDYILHSGQDLVDVTRPSHLTCHSRPCLLCDSAV